MSLLQRITGKINRTWRAACYGVGVEKLLYGAHPPKKIVLMYHGIDRVGRNDFNVRHISAKDFETHLNYYQKRFELLPVKEIFTSRPGKRPQIALSFDDGLMNNFKYALPLLDAKKIPATFYSTSIRGKNQHALWPDAVDIYSQHLTTFHFHDHVFHRAAHNGRLYTSEGQGLNPFVSALSWTDKCAVIEALQQQAGFDLREKTELADYFELMGERELRETAASDYVTIGSHGCYHNRLDLLSDADATEELRHSKKFLEDATGKTVDEIAFPEGGYSRHTLALAEAAGYHYQLAVRLHHEEDVNDARVLPRFGLYGDRSAVEHLHQVNKVLSDPKRFTG